MFQNSLKRKMKSGQTVFGTFLVINSPDIVEIVALSSYDFVIIDTEHGPLSIESTQHLIRAAELRGITPITRTTNALETTILRSLDVGAHGIQVPQVNDYKTAKTLIQAAKYFPLGNRGLAMPRSADYGTLDPITYFQAANEETLIVVHCENTQGLENLEEIVTLPEIDVVFLGPFDMSQSLGIPGQIHHPAMDEVVEKVIGITKKAGKAAGVFVTDGKQAQLRARQGFQYIAIGMDTIFLSKIYKQELIAATGNVTTK
ncbi:MAG: aldolase/citrate lyase family protein [Thermotaleaceae bacterium]